MCKNECCSNDQQDKRPVLCVTNLSRSSQEYLRVTTNNANVVQDVPGFSNHSQKLRELAELSVDFCINMDPCCTSKVAFEDALNFMSFLDNTSQQPGVGDYRIYQFIVGAYDCQSGCC